MNVFNACCDFDALQTCLFLMKQKVIGDKGL